MANTKTLTRSFRMGSTRLPDPDQTMTPEQVKELYSANYAHLANAIVEEPVVEGDTLCYEFSPAPVKTKG